MAETERGTGAGSQKGAPKKPTKTAGAAARKSSQTAGAAAKKPAKRASAAAKKPATTGSSAGKPAKRARAAAKPTKDRKSAGAPAATAAAKKAAPRPPAKRTMVQETARSYFEALSARDAEAAARVWDEAGIDDIVPLGIFRGRAAIQALLQEMFTAMPDSRFTVERITADGEVAAVQWRVTGTFSAGSFQGLEPTGRRVELRGSDCLQVADGKIVHNTGIFDGAAFARQVGLLPPEDSGADRAMRAGFNTVTKLRRTVARRTSR